MSLPGIETARRVARRYASRFFQRPIILAYHRVADLDCDPQLLSVTRRHFAEHLHVIRERSQPMRLQELALALRKGGVIPSGVVVTFDDGYADNLIHAKPILERHEVPATVFVTTGYTGEECDFWWDELDKMLLQTDVLPAVLRVSVSGRAYQWDLKGTPKANGELLNGRWSITESRDPTPRHAAYRTLHQLLRPMAEEERRLVLGELRLWACGVEALSHGEALSAAEIIKLARGGLVEVGSHSVTHPVFASLPIEAQRLEIEKSKKDLEEILGLPVCSFAYPYGGKKDYTADTLATVQKAGYLCACANFPAPVKATTDVFQLPRYLVRDWDGDEFRRRLGQWLSG
jgi:peptidoglycan/xylan/chitin deacetylase (PgdA/CDA1 family)